MGSRMKLRRAAYRAGKAFTLIELLVVMAILAILAGLVAGVVHAARKRALEQGTKAEIGILETGLAEYRREFGRYPPDDIVPLGGSAENGMNEAMVYHLCRRIVIGPNEYGPYSEIGLSRFADSDGDGFRELRDPYGNLYQYAENASHAAPTGANARSYDIVSPGSDGELGGTISPDTGYVPATSPEGRRAEADNIMGRGN